MSESSTPAYSSFTWHSWVCCSEDREQALKRVAKGQDSDLDTTALAELVALYTAHARFEEAEYLPLAHTILSRGRHSMEALALALHLRHSPAVVGYI